MSKKLTREEELKLEVKEEVRVYAKIKFGYSQKIVLPYEDGLLMMKCFAHAETLDESYNEDSKIYGIKDPPELSILPQPEYQRIKMETLLTAGQESTDS